VALDDPQRKGRGGALGEGGGNLILRPQLARRLAEIKADAPPDSVRLADGPRVHVAVLQW